MEAISNLLSWSRLGLTIVVYFVTLACYRLFLHPLSRFPGPRLAAVSRWYEAYYDVVQNGQYTFKIAELHKQYGKYLSAASSVPFSALSPPGSLLLRSWCIGPIIRISPHELHISDPAFFDQIYRQDGVWDKYGWAVNAFATQGATLFTAKHDLHKARRQPLNQFFSKARVSSRQDMIHWHMGKLCNRISIFAESQETFNFGAAITAFARDVAFDFILGKSYKSLDKDDFDEAMVTATSGSGQVWRVSKHLRFIGPMLKSIPIDLIIKYGDHGTKLFFRFLKVNLVSSVTFHCPPRESCC